MGDKETLAMLPDGSITSRQPDIETIRANAPATHVAIGVVDSPI